MKTFSLAPVALFAYARPDHLRRTLDALSKNRLAEQTIVRMYCDGAKNSKDWKFVDETRAVARSASGFAQVEIIERENNLGVAENIIQGVGETIAKYWKVIVVEDDIETAPAFLEWMNAALAHYEDNPRVWHVTGWTYPVDLGVPGDAFFWRVMNCWGWGTWADRWQYFRRDVEMGRDWSDEKRRRFNLDGAHDFHRQLRLNRIGRIRTWAIFWYATIFENDWLCLNPTHSLVKNIGLDGSGVHCTGDESLAGILDWRTAPSLDFSSVPVEESRIVCERIARWYRETQGITLKRIIAKLRKFFGV